MFGCSFFYYLGVQYGDFPSHVAQADEGVDGVGAEVCREVLHVVAALARPRVRPV